MNRKLTIVATVAVALLAGCDPYGSENKSQPVVLRVVAFGGDANADPATVDPIFAAAPAAAGAPWTLSSAGVTPTQGPLSGKNAIQIQANKLLDGKTIQTAPLDCTPVPGSITISVPPPSGVWCVCYNPNSPNVDQGGSVEVFSCDDPTAPDPFSGTMPATPFTITGTVKDQQGQPLVINVAVTPP